MGNTGSTSTKGIPKALVKVAIIDMAIVGKTMYTISVSPSKDDSTINTYDITNPAKPISINQTLISLPNILYTTFTADGNYIYIVDNNTNVINLYDLTGRLVTPNFITGLPSGATYYPQTMRIVNNNLYIVWNNSGVSYYTLNPSAPTTPISAPPVSLIDPSGTRYVTAITVFNNYLYVAIDNIIYSYDVSSSPKFITAITGVNYSVGLSIIGNILFSSDDKKGVVQQYVLNGSTATLVKQSVKSGLTAPFGLLIYSTDYGNYLYIANAGGDQGIVTYKIQNNVYTPLVQRIGSMSTRYGNNYGKSAHSRPYYCNPLQMGDDIAIDVSCQSLALLTSQNSSQISFRVLKSGYYNPNNPSSYLGTLNYT